MSIRKMLGEMIKRGASDLFYRAGGVPRLRIDGKVVPLSQEILTTDDVLRTVEELTPTRQKEVFESKFDIDFALFLEEFDRRFRVSIFMQRNSPSMVIRNVIPHAKKFEELNLPVDILKKLSLETRGLILLTGSAGSGKSTTIASMIDYINVTSEQHIVTIEDPIEFLFESKKSIINQRELGVDVLSYANALKHVTQQSPDIIYIGNIRDVDTMRAAINATELGAFVLTTFHTINAVQTLTRIINFFPPYLHDEVRLQLSNILKGVVSMRLLPRLDKTGRVPAYETMVVTPTIARLIREGDFNKVQHFIDEGELFGMQSFRKSLIKLVRDGRVSEDDARHVAFSKDEFNLEMKGIQRFDK